MLLLFILSQKTTLCIFFSVIIICFTYMVAKYLIQKRQTYLLTQHIASIKTLQQKLWLKENNAYYIFSKKLFVNEKGFPISISKYKENLISPKFIGNNLPTKGIRVGISGFSPLKHYIINKTLNVYLEPIANTTIWKVKSNIVDRTILTHPIMGELILDGISTQVKDQKEVKIYQRITYIGKDCLVQYELREN